MTGLEKITEQIMSDSKAVCDKIIGDAKNKAEAITQKGKADAEIAYSSAVAEAEKSCKAEYAKAVSSADALVKKNALRKKSNVIGEIIKEAEKKLNSLSGDEYYTAVQRLIIKNKTGEKGELLMSADDIKNMPKGFSDNFSELTPVSADIGKGFVLRYGGIEQNCTFDSLLDSELDSVKDMLYKMIFA